MPQQAYRLRIRTADNSSDALVITSVRSGTNPYIASVPSGDGQEVDLLTGAVRTGAYVVEVVDAVTGSSATGTLRLVTSQLYDGTEEYLLLENGDKILLEDGDPIELELNNAEYGRVHLLSRRAFLEVSTDGGATFPTVWQAGFLSNVTQIDALRYAFTISNTRRVEQTQRVFTWSTAAEQTAFPQRGCIVGGPVIGGFGAKPTGGSIALDSGGWEFEFLGSVNSGFSIFSKSGYYLSLEFRFGGVAPNYERKSVFSKEETDLLYAGLNPFVQYDSGVSAFDLTFVSNIWNGLKNRNKVCAYPNLTAIITDQNGNEWRGSIPSFFSPSETGSWYIPGISSSEGGNRLFVRLYDNFTDVSGNPITAMPAVGTRLRVRIVSNETTPQAPLYFDLHPVDVVTKLYDIANISYKSDPTAPYEVGSAEWMKERLGSTLRVAARITEPQVMAEFLEKSIFGPFGFACRTGPTGAQEFFITRELGGTIDYTITDADIQGDAPPSIWSLDEGTAVTGFLIKQKQLTQWVQPANTKEIGPPDNLVETAQPIQYLNGDTTTFSTRIVEYDIPGMVHDAASFTPSIEPLGKSIALEGFERFGRGAPASEIPVLGTSAAAAAQVGDLVYLNAGYYPNKNYRIGESNVGPRVAQIVRRDERPEGPVFKLVDAGLTNQPALPPFITIAASTTDPYRIAQFTITNGAALSNTNEILCTVEWATGATEPTLAGQTFQRYAKGAIPSAPVQLPAVIPGTKVWVRARTEQEGLFPSLWTAWTSVTLTAWNVPTSLTISGLTSGKARLTWSNGSNTTDNIDVYLVTGTVAPSDWMPYRLTTLTSGTTYTSLLPLTASTNYLVGLAYVDTLSNARGSVVYTTFTTNSTAMPTASRPAGLAVIPGVEDNGIWAAGVQLALYSAAGETTTIIERAPNIVIGGIDTPGVYAEIFRVPASQDQWTNYLPVDGTKYWYRTRHATPGKNNSNPTTGVMAVAEAIPYTVFTMAPQVPIVSVETSEAGSTATITIDISDPQYRLEQVRFREQTNGGGWSAWTVDTTAPYTYSATIPITGFVEIEYEVTGFGADGISRVLAAGVESFDTNTFANIVSASGTFGLDGSLEVAIQADTDTNSFKYAFALTPWATDALAYTAAQAGTLVNGRNTSITLPGPYAVGSSVYLAIAGYTGASGSGTASGPYRYSFLNGSRDTIPLMGRARVTATTDTTVTIRYAVACPVAPSPNTVSIAYSSTGVGTITPASPQTVTPQLADVVSEAAGSYADFTVDRPAYGQPSGRITFTATATGRVASTDSVDVPATGLVYNLCQATQTASDATSITVTVTASAATGTPQVKLKALTGTATRTAGAAVGTLVASGSSWTFSRGAFESGPSQAEFEAVLAGTIADIDYIEIPEQGRDTVPLVTRARVTATTATSVTVRVAVADPYPQGANSATIAYSTTGLGTVTQTNGNPLPSPIQVTPAATLTEAAGTYYDFLVPRPSAGAGMGRITFTVTAANRVEDADATDVVPAILVYSLCEATQTNATETAIEVTVTATADNGTPEVRYTGLDGTATKFSGPALNTLSPSGTTWVFTRGAFDTGPSQASFESVLAGAVTDVDFITIPEQQRDTVPLIARARVTAVDADNVTVRVAVADPYPQGTNSGTIAYTTTGLGSVSPASGGTVTPASTLTEASGTYIDYTVPRPTNGSAPGRITFTATAANRTSDSDAADIVPKNPVPASLDVTYVIYSDNYVISWAGGSGTTVTVSINGAAYTTPSASPITVSRNLYTETDKVYTFKGTGTGGDIVTNTVVVARQDPVIPNLPQITAAYFDNGSTPGDGGGSVDVYWTDTDMPAGVTYDIYLTNITGDPITASSASDLGNTASPVTVAVALGPGAEATCTIEAYDGATLIATYSFRSYIPI